MNTTLSILSDLNIFSFSMINSGLDNHIFDFLMPLITDFGSIIAWILIFMLMFTFGGQRTKKIAILGLSALFIADVTVYVLKYLVAEPRPFLTLTNVELLVPEEHSYSFPSGHAASSFASAYVIGSKIKITYNKNNYGVMYLMMAFAVLIGFSRIYIGVHYPYDVIVGALVGIISAMMVMKLWNNIYIERISRINQKNDLTK